MNQQNVFGFLNTFGGGALQNFSILAMGIMPYITASIIMQLLQMDVVPKFAEWKKQGEMGRKKISPSNSIWDNCSCIYSSNCNVRLDLMRWQVGY